MLRGLALLLALAVVAGIVALARLPQGRRAPVPIPPAEPLALGHPAAELEAQREARPDSGHPSGFHGLEGLLLDERGNARPEHVVVAVPESMARLERRDLLEWYEPGKLGLVAHECQLCSTDGAGRFRITGLIEGRWFLFDVEQCRAGLLDPERTLHELGERGIELRWPQSLLCVRVEGDEGSEPGFLRCREVNQWEDRRAEFKSFRTTGRQADIAVLPGLKYQVTWFVRGGASASRTIAVPPGTPRTELVLRPVAEEQGWLKIEASGDEPRMLVQVIDVDRMLDLEQVNLERNALLRVPPGEYTVIGFGTYHGDSTPVEKTTVTGRGFLARARICPGETTKIEARLENMLLPELLLGLPPAGPGDAGPANARLEWPERMHTARVTAVHESGYRQELMFDPPGPTPNWWADTHIVPGFWTGTQSPLPPGLWTFHAHAPGLDYAATRVLLRSAEPARITIPLR